jgi:hypothetical protein
MDAFEFKLCTVRVVRVSLKKSKFDIVPGHQTVTGRKLTASIFYCAKRDWIGVARHILKYTCTR